MQLHAILCYNWAWTAVNTKKDTWQTTLSLFWYIWSACVSEPNICQVVGLDVKQMFLDFTKKNENDNQLFR